MHLVTHHFTVDVEEYYHVSALEPYVERAAWNRLESRVTGSVERLLGLLASHNACGTFFILGMVADKHPSLVKLIVGEGHEVASHGWDHTRVTQQTPDEFRDSVSRTKQVLEDLTGSAVMGFRAPSFSIVPGCEWAIDILIEAGYRYDSSLFPVNRNGYGYPGGQRDPHWLGCASGRLLEVPPATLRRWGLNLPAAGGAYFRLLPYGLVRAALKDSEARGAPATFYIHPWELDPHQPRLSVSWATRLRHYGGLGRTGRRLERLLAEFPFCTISETLSCL